MAKRLTFKPDIDVRGQRGEEALANIQSFIDESIMLRQKTPEFCTVKDTESLRNYPQLSSHRPCSTIVRDEDVQLGGAGITVVELNNTTFLH
jgi:DNA mismatch repair protein MutS2